MGTSEIMRRGRERLRQQRQQERDEQERQRAAEAAAAPAMLRRPEAAAYLGLRESTLRSWYAAGTGPRAVKTGTARQSRVFYAVEELDQWRRDPQGYAAPARDHGPFEPPRRGSARGPA